MLIDKLFSCDSSIVKFNYENRPKHKANDTHNNYMVSEENCSIKCNKSKYSLDYICLHI